MENILLLPLASSQWWFNWDVVFRDNCYLDGKSSILSFKCSVLCESSHWPALQILIHLALITVFIEGLIWRWVMERRTEARTLNDLWPETFHLKLFLRTQTKTCDFKRRTKIFLINHNTSDFPVTYLSSYMYFCSFQIIGLNQGQWLKYLDNWFQNLK